MNRTDQIIFSALCIPLLISIMIGDYTTTLPMSIPPMIVYIVWYNRERIRSNEKLMRVLKKVF
jgi:hypothetical protein